MKVFDIDLQGHLVIISTEETAFNVDLVYWSSLAKGCYTSQMCSCIYWSLCLQMCSCIIFFFVSDDHYIPEFDKNYSLRKNISVTIAWLSNFLFISMCVSYFMLCLSGEDKNQNYNIYTWVCIYENQNCFEYMYAIVNISKWFYAVCEYWSEWEIHKNHHANSGIH